MNVVLGSTSEQKLSIAHEALVGRLEVTSLTGASAESQVSDQPLSLLETEKGATNRAKNAFALKTADIAIGLEGGLEHRSDGYNLICIAALFDGTNTYTGESELIALPQEVSDQIEQGGQFGEVIREYKQLHPEMSEHELKIVEELISRSHSFTTAIYRALDLMKAMGQARGESLSSIP